jgi:hypothetical protein
MIHHFIKEQAIADTDGEEHMAILMRLLKLHATKDFRVLLQLLIMMCLRILLISCCAHINLRCRCSYETTNYLVEHWWRLVGNSEARS